MYSVSARGESSREIESSSCALIHPPKTSGAIRSSLRRSANQRSAHRAAGSSLGPQNPLTAIS